MSGTSRNTLKTMRDLESLNEMLDPAERPRQQVNTHIHLPPNFSAFSSVKQAVDLARQQGVTVLGAGNYYDFEVYEEFESRARHDGIFPLLGLEIICMVPDLAATGVKINDPGNPGKFYLCGKGITQYIHMTAEAKRLLDLIRGNDAARMRRVIARLIEVFNRSTIQTDLDEAAIVDAIARRYRCPRTSVYLQERHLCQAFQERFFERVPSEKRIEALTRLFGAAPKAAPGDAVAIQNEIRSCLLKAGQSAYVEEAFVTFEQACDLVGELGGLLCYPTLVDGTNPICPFEAPVDELIERLQQRNIGCAEFIPARNSPEVLTEYVLAMRSAGLIVTAGTEHNTLDMLPIQLQCAKGTTISDELLWIFWEGACVIAAHQYLVLKRQKGFEAGCGEIRIAELATIGASVIQKYQAATTDL